MYGGEANTHFTTGPWSVRSKLNKSECVQWARLCTDRGWGALGWGPVQLR